jgi:hypothetical protein
LSSVFFLHILPIGKAALVLGLPPVFITEGSYQDYGEIKYMGGNGKDGYYCSICGGIPPDKITTKRVVIDGRETGIDHLDWIFGEVARLAVDNDDAVTGEILKRVKQFNYVPTKKTMEYGAGLLGAYKKFWAETQ